MESNHNDRELWQATYHVALYNGTREQDVTVSAWFPAETPACDIDDRLQEKAHDKLGTGGDWDILDGNAEFVR